MAEHGAATEWRAAQTLLVSFTSLLSYMQAELGAVEASNTRQPQLEALAV